MSGPFLHSMEPVHHFKQKFVAATADETFSLQDGAQRAERRYSAIVFKTFYF